MLAPTWHFLKANDAAIEIPEGLTIAPRVSVSELGAALGASDAFENALASAQEEWEETHPAPTEAELADRAAFLAAEADATYGGTAQSGYQINADALEETRSLSVAFEHGVGEEAAAYLRYTAGERIVVIADPGKQVDAEVVVTGVAGTLSAAAIDVIANASSTVNLSITVVDEENDEPENVSPALILESSNESRPNVTRGRVTCHIVSGKLDESKTRSLAHPACPAGVTGTTVRVFADADARVNIARTQTLDDSFTDIDDMGLFANDRARIDIRQTVLGGGAAFAGLAGDLRGDSAHIDVDTRYLGYNDQKRDLNYVLRHHGTRTECNLKANGVLAGRSRKTLRGTIDLIRGAKEAQGSENETVLLVDEGVRNKTVPVILCNEDDVAGNHGATIGHIRDEQLFYLASRGLSQEAAERMFVSAVVEQAVIDAPSMAARVGAIRLGERIAPGFAEQVGFNG